MDIQTYIKQIPITDISQGTDATDIARGLADGRYRRHGGIIREAPGKPTGGQIIAHLRDIGDVNGQGSSLNIPGGGASPSGALSKTLQSTLKMSQVAAAASVLNLGVSVAGFAYMAKRMNDLQSDLARLDRKLDGRFDHVDEQLAAVLVRLDEIRHVVHANHAHGVALREEVRAVRDALFGAQKGRLMAALEMVDVGESTLESNLQIFKEVRHALQEELQDPPSFRSAERLVDVGVRLRVWSIAAAAEALALVRLGKTEAAVQQYRSSGTTAHQLSRSWVRSALPEADWTIWAHSRFERTVGNERLQRVARTMKPRQSPDQFNRARSSGAIRNDAYVTRLTEDQKARHDSAATLADAAVEVGDRLSSNAEEIRLCVNNGISIEEWQDIGASTGQPLLLLPSNDDWT